MEYRTATIDDLELLCELRIEVLCAANLLPVGTPMPDVKAQTRSYYLKALSDDTHVTYLAFDGDVVAGCGSVSFYQVMPTYNTPSGWHAYFMNMYTRPAYRRKRIGMTLLDLLVRESYGRGITAIALEASEAGRNLYRSYGFVASADEMYLPFDAVRTMK